MKEQKWYNFDKPQFEWFSALGLIALTTIGLLGGFVINDYVNRSKNEKIRENAYAEGYENGTTDGFENGSNSRETTTRNIHPVIDGKFEEEWKYSDIQLGQFFDVNNTIDPETQTICVDGNNFLYVGQDSDYLYILADLCSDRTNSINNEWISVFLNTRNLTFDTTHSIIPDVFGFEDYWNNGTESFVYSTQLGSVVPLIWDIGKQTNNTFWVRNDSIEEGVNWVNISRGFASNEYSKSQDWDNDAFQGISDYYPDDISPINDRFSMNVSIDIFKDMYYWIDSQYYDEILNDISDVQILACINVGKYSQMQFLARNELEMANITVEGSGTFNLNLTSSDPFEIPNYNMTIINVTKESLSHGFLNFSIDVWNPIDLLNPSDYYVFIDYLAVNFNVSRYIDPIYGTSTIRNNYQIAYTFGKTPNCDIDHRIFEIAIKISELEGYNPSGYLGVYVQGYGTLVFDYVGYEPEIQYDMYYLAFETYYFGTTFYYSFVPFISKSYIYSYMDQKRKILV